MGDQGGHRATDARSWSRFTLVQETIRTHSPFEDNIGSVAAAGGLKSTVHPPAFVFENGTADLDSCLLQPGYACPANQWMGIGAPENHRWNAGIDNGLRAGWSSAMMIARFKTDVEGGQILLG